MPDSELSDLLMDVIPLVMRVMRRELRRHIADLSMPQLRVLRFVDRHPGVSLKRVAEHIGLTLPASSQLVEVLVTRGMIRRVTSTEDRRYVDLSLTIEGKSTLDAARAATRKYLAEQLSTLPDDKRLVISQAMGILHDVFEQEKEVPPGSGS